MLRKGRNVGPILSSPSFHPYRSTDTCRSEGVTTPKKNVLSWLFGELVFPILSRTFAYPTQTLALLSQAASQPTEPHSYCPDAGSARGTSSLGGENPGESASAGPGRLLGGHDPSPHNLFTPELDLNVLLRFSFGSTVLGPGA